MLHRRMLQGLVAVGTPAERMLTLIGQLLEGRMPPIEDIVSIRAVSGLGASAIKALSAATALWNC